MKTVIIKSKTILSETGEEEIIPVIQFDQFPKGQRSAGPDENGNLIWTVVVED